ncbi:hypothetical protein Dsin_000714 [Dipteronia sinensis]|uniref:Uncharacterized protein n=1 Tax=Dipteronia sinensis TaxID=43782 RepID=A0AAE0EHN8_9ROSI|nr:hypothetical protein Dsin_000714 [Dipteronia sinensis]
MKIFGWNAQGLGSSRAFNTLRYHKQETRAEMVFLMVTRCIQENMEILRVKLGYTGKLVVDSVGKSGGLYLMWDSSIDVVLMSYSQGHIDVRIHDENNRNWRFTGFYGHPEQAQRTNS